HLAAARALVRDCPLTNVEILKLDIHDTRLPRDAFDFVHARLADVSHAWVDALLAELLALTRPGGVVAIRCAARLANWRSRSIEVWQRNCVRHSDDRLNSFKEMVRCH